MDAQELPSEEEQFAAYQKVALRMKDQPVSSQVYAKGSLVRRGTTDF